MNRELVRQHRVCPTCGLVNEGGARFCGKCGKRLELPVVESPRPENEEQVFCPSCRQAVQPDDTFCGRCGARVQQAAPGEDAVAPTIVAPLPLPSPPAPLPTIVEPIDPADWFGAGAEADEESSPQDAAAAAAAQAMIGVDFDDDEESLSGDEGAADEAGENAAGIRDSDSPPEKAPQTMQCALCGGANPQSELLCDSCGAPLHTVQLGMPEIPPPPPLNLDNLDDLTLHGIEVFCGDCGASADIEDEACGSCGAPMKDSGEDGERSAATDTSDIATDLTPARASAAAVAAALIHQAQGSTSETLGVGEPVPTTRVVQLEDDFDDQEYEDEADEEEDDRWGETYELPVPDSDRDGLSAAHFEGLAHLDVLEAPPAPPAAAPPRRRGASGSGIAEPPPLFVERSSPRGSRGIALGLVALVLLGGGVAAMLLNGGDDPPPADAKPTASPSPASPRPSVVPSPEFAATPPAPSDSAATADAPPATDPATATAAELQRYFDSIGERFVAGDLAAFAGEDLLREAAARNFASYSFESAVPTLVSHKPAPDGASTEARVSWDYRLRDRRRPDAPALSATREAVYTLSRTAEGWHVDQLK